MPKFWSYNRHIIQYSIALISLGEGRATCDSLRGPGRRGLHGDVRLAECVHV